MDTQTETLIQAMRMTVPGTDPLVSCFSSAKRARGPPPPWRVSEYAVAPSCCEAQLDAFTASWSLRRAERGCGCESGTQLRAWR
jgi:hypothetical protein